MSENLEAKRLIEEVFDTTKTPWARKACGREKCRKLIVALEEMTYTDGFGDSERCEIPDKCIENIRKVYEKIRG